MIDTKREGQRPKTLPSAVREKRLAAALRENLRRRKVAARTREKEKPGPSAK
jgi:hypothetical protein